MKPMTRSALPLRALIVPAMMALWSSQYLVETFFPDLTLIDLGPFYAMRLFSGPATGILFARPSNAEG